MEIMTSLLSPYYLLFSPLAPSLGTAEMYGAAVQGRKSYSDMRGFH